MLFDAKTCQGFVVKISKGEGIKAAMWTTLMGICSKVLDVSGSRLIVVLRMLTNRWYRSFEQELVWQQSQRWEKERGRGDKWWWLAQTKDFNSIFQCWVEYFGTGTRRWDGRALVGETWPKTNRQGWARGSPKRRALNLGALILVQKSR